MKFATGVILNTLWIISLYFGLCKGYTGFLNIALFAVWVNIVAAFISLFVSGVVGKVLIKNHGFGQIYGNICNFIAIGLLVYCGRIVSAVFLSVACLLVHGIKENAKEAHRNKGNNHDETDA